MMIFNKEARERWLRDILADMKSKLDAENDYGLVVGYDKIETWKGDEFKYEFYIDYPGSAYMDSLTYDTYIEFKNYAKEAFNFLLSNASFDLTVSENDKFGTAFEITSIANRVPED